MTEKEAAAPMPIGAALNGSVSSVSDSAPEKNSADFNLAADFEEVMAGIDLDTWTPTDDELAEWAEGQRLAERDSGFLLDDDAAHLAYLLADPVDISPGELARREAAVTKDVLEHLTRNFAGRDDPMYSFELRRQHVRDLIARDRELAAWAEQPDIDGGLLSDLLSREPEPVPRIAELMPADANTTIVAQRKTGKTTLVGNLLRCLVTGEDFLERFTVNPIPGDARVALLNYEVSPHQIARWLHDMGVPGDRVWIGNFRGRPNPLRSSVGRRDLAARLRDAGVVSLVVDPFSNAYAGTGGQNGVDDVAPWLAMLNEFARTDVGVSDLVMAVHAGWNGERSRGSSSLEDWPDAIWTLERDAKTKERTIRADGRDVSLDKHVLRMDEHRRLTVDGVGVDLDVLAHHKMRAEIAELLGQSPGLSVNAIIDALSGRKDERRAALNSMISDGSVHRKKRQGKGGGYEHFIT